MRLKDLSDAIQKVVQQPLRTALVRLLGRIGIGDGPDDPRQTNKLAFTIAIVALSAKMAKADGIVSDIERDAFRTIFQTSEADARRVDQIFDLAQQDVAGFESYARQIANLLDGEEQLKRDVLEGLFNIAAADGVLHDREDAYLRTVAEIFGFSDVDYLSVRAQFVHDPDDAYTVLGLTRDASNEVIKARYRRLVRENHPDAMVSRGVPEEFIDMATRMLASINNAYDQIARERGL